MTSDESDLSRMRQSRFFVRAIATVLYSGYSPVAPGTAGSAVAALGYYFFCSSLTALEWILLLFGTFSVAVYTADVMAREWGSDPGPVVIDELAGYLVSVAFLPHSVWIAVAGFFVFRAFDIVKPPPIRKLERLSGGWGIVLDDILAGVYSQLILWVLVLVVGWSEI